MPWNVCLELVFCVSDSICGNLYSFLWTSMPESLFSVVLFAIISTKKINLVDRKNTSHRLCRHRSCLDLNSGRWFGFIFLFLMPISNREKDECNSRDVYDIALMQYFCKVHIWSIDSVEVITVCMYIFCVYLTKYENGGHFIHPSFRYQLLHSSY